MAFSTSDKQGNLTIRTGRKYYDKCGEANRQTRAQFVVAWGCDKFKKTIIETASHLTLSNFLNST